MLDVTRVTHRDIFPHTDHGYIWTEHIWYENAAGERVSATIPAAACNERLGTMPGGPLPTFDYEYEERRFNVTRAVKSETLHGRQYYRVGSVCITPDRELDK